MRRPLIAPLVALFLPAILTGCHLSHTPSPALSMATVAVSVVGLLVAQSLISLGAKRGRVDLDHVLLAGVRDSTR
jgi:hypothetical protein